MENENSVQHVMPPEHGSLMTGGPAPVINVQPQTMAEQLTRFQTGSENATAVAPAPAAPTAPEAAPVYIGTQKYNTEDLIREVQEFQKVKATIAPPAAPVEDDLSEIMFTDPKKFTTILEERASNRAKSQILAEQKQVDTRNKFYSTYKDLNNAKELVEYYAVKMQGDIANDSEDVALSKLAQAVRGKIAAIKGSAVATEELSSRPAVTAGAVGSPISAGTSQASKAPESFIDQMRTAFKKGRTRY